MRLYGHLPDIVAREEHEQFPREGFAGNARFTQAGGQALLEAAKKFPVLDQVGSSCTGHAARYAIEARMHLVYGTHVELSPMAIYRGGCILGGYAHEDGGARPYDVVNFMSKHGIVSEKRWPSTPTNLLASQLPLDVIANGYDARVTGWGRIYKRGLLTSLCQALTNEFPAILAMTVDAAMDSDAPGVIREMKGKARGSHMIALFAYEADSEDPSGFVFHGKNSWGTGYKEGGYFRIGGQRVLDSGSDFYVLDAAPSGAY